MDHAAAHTNILEMLATLGEPLTEAQATMLAGGLAVWLDKAKEAGKAEVRDLVNDYHLDLDARKGGTVSANRLASRLETMLGMEWVPGAASERKRNPQIREIQQARRR